MAPSAAVLAGLFGEAAIPFPPAIELALDRAVKSALGTGEPLGPILDLIAELRACRALLATPAAGRA